MNIYATGGGPNIYNSSQQSFQHFFDMCKIYSSSCLVNTSFENVLKISHDRFQRWHDNHTKTDWISSWNSNFLCDDILCHWDDIIQLPTHLNKIRESRYEFKAFLQTFQLNLHWQFSKGILSFQIISFISLLMISFVANCL